MSDHEQLASFPVRLYDAVIEDTMAIVRAGKKGAEAMQQCIAEQNEMRAIRKSKIGSMAAASELSVVPVEMPTNENQLRFIV
jgi:hypothetical protein